MGKKKIAICDSDAVYRERFAAYLANHKAGEMTVHTFSDEERLLKQVETEGYALVILAAEYKYVAPGLGQKKMPVLILTDEMADFVAEGTAFTEDATEREIVYTSRFQSMDTMIRKICFLVETVEDGGAKKTAVSRLEVVGVYSPIQHEMQQMFSVLYAMQMAEEKKVLYVNFLEYSGFLELFGQYGEYDMGDIVLGMRSGKLTRERFYQCIYEMRGISLILPFQNPENLREFCYKDWQEFLAYVAGNTEYEMLVVDFGSGTERLAQTLSDCSLVYGLMREGYVYQCRLAAFLDYVKKTGEEKLEERLEIVNLPYSAKNLRSGGNLIEQLNWSEFGDFVRSYRLGGRS